MLSKNGKLYMECQAVFQCGYVSVACTVDFDFLGFCSSLTIFGRIALQATACLRAPLPLGRLRDAYAPPARLRARTAETNAKGLSRSVTRHAGAQHCTPLRTPLR
jgi:hypothetical protein